MLTRLSTLAVLLVALVSACNVDAPVTASLMVPADIMPPVAVNPQTGELEPVGTAEQYIAFLDWTAAHSIAESNKPTPVQGPSYCQDITQNLMWCTQADGKHHWMTPSGCYDLNGQSIACW